MAEFSAYIALGDSMSIDLYPSIDMGQPPDTLLGAASLLYKNHEGFWPDFKGRDLTSLYPAIEFLNLTEDGATTLDMLGSHYLELTAKYHNEPVLITLTIGGNDALQLLGLDPAQPAKLTAAVAAIVDRYQKVVGQIEASFSRATVILNTIYDPSDGTGIAPRMPPFASLLPFLRYFNDQIRGCAAAKTFLLADVHKYFMGHGVKAQPEECFYWETNMIEPSGLGASQLRALWLATLGA